MPLTAKGRKIKRAMQRQYGRNKGERVFYAWEHAHRGIKKRGRVVSHNASKIHYVRRIWI